MAVTGREAHSGLCSRKSNIMGKTTVSRVWAITLTGGNATIPPTTETGVDFTFNSKEWNYVAGPPEGATETEQPNQHLGIKCKTRAVTKGQARAALAHILGLSETVFFECYFKPVETTWAQYVAYCFKQHLGRVGLAIRTAQQELLNAGQLATKKAILEKLASTHDFQFFCRSLKPAVNEYVSLDCMHDMRGIETEEFSPVTNRLSFLGSFKILQTQIYKCFQLNQVTTNWEKLIWDSIPQAAKIAICEVLALLPIFTKRRKTIPDGLPGLYFWGKPCTGKSAFFNNGIFLRNFPLDAQGVSRFRLECFNSGYLFDDVAPDFLDKSDISSTLRQLTLGNAVNVKTHGSTETVSGYVVVTSNNKPQFLYDIKPTNSEIDDDHWESNCNAWKRRFITLNFTEYVDADPCSIIWNDPKIREHAAHLAYCSLLFLFGACRPLYDKYFRRIRVLIDKDYGHMDTADLAGYSVAGSEIMDGRYFEAMLCEFDTENTDGF